MLFWSAFILTRPLGATLGDPLDKPVDPGGFAIGRFAASGVWLLLCLLLGPGRTMRAEPACLGHREHEREAEATPVPGPAREGSNAEATTAGSKPRPASATSIVNEPPARLAATVVLDHPELETGQVGVDPMAYSVALVRAHAWSHRSAW